MFVVFNIYNIQLAAKEAYLAAKAEVADEDRRRILAEFRTIIQEAATIAAESATDKVAAAKVASTVAEAALLASNDNKGLPSNGAPPTASGVSEGAVTGAVGLHGEQSGVVKLDR